MSAMAQLGAFATLLRRSAVSRDAKNDVARKRRFCVDEMTLVNEILD
jgi:hypothetical protein